MRIGVNTRFLLSNKMEGFGWYTFETFSRIVRNHPEHKFIFFFDRKYDKKFLFSSNVVPVVLPPQTRHPLLQKIWFDYAIPWGLKKYNCDAFISPDGYLSLKTNIPQLAVIHDLNFEHNKKDLPKTTLNFYKKRFPLFAKKAARICTVSDFSKKDIAQLYKIPENKIDVSYNGASPAFQVLSDESKASTRLKYTDGQPYVLFVGAIHKRKNIQRLLYAFEQIKKKEETPHHLLIVGEPMWRNQNIQIPESLKQITHFTGHVSHSHLTSIVGSATCLAFVSYFEGFGIPMVEAMQSGVPVLSGNKTALPEIGGDAVLYCNPYSTDSIQQHLTTLLKDTALQSSLSKKGIERAKLFSWDNTAHGLWESFLVMMSKENETVE